MALMNTDKKEPTYNGESEAMFGCALEVHSGLGFGFNEKPYELGACRGSWNSQYTHLKIQKVNSNPIHSL